jgi:solute carrier family 35 protein E3
MLQILPLAAAFVGYIVFWNLSLQLNSVGFYQLSKILIAPAIIILEAVWFSKLPSRLELAAVALLCIGVTLATVSDSEASILTLHTACLCNHHACVCSLPHYFSSGC